MPNALRTSEEFVPVPAVVPERLAPHVERVDIYQHKPELIALFERSGRPEFASRFDWYYHDDGQKPMSWVLRESGGAISGVCSVTLRSLRYGARSVRAGVAGNLLIDRGKGGYLGAISLVRAMKSLVTSHDIDVLLGIPNALSEPIFTRLEFTIIDRWITHAFVHHSGKLLQTRLGWPGTIARPLLDLCAAAVEKVTSPDSLQADSLRVVNVTERDFSEIPFHNWAVPEGRFVMCPSKDYLLTRFLKAPLSRYSFSILANSSGKACGCIVLRHGKDRSWIADCWVDFGQIDEVTAISQFCRSKHSTSNMVWIAHLRSAPLSKQLASHGFIRMAPALGGYPNLPLVGFWLAGHPLAYEFSQASSWGLFTGFNDV